MSFYHTHFLLYNFDAFTFHIIYIDDTHIVFTSVNTLERSHIYISTRGDSFVFTSFPFFYLLVLVFGGVHHCWCGVSKISVPKHHRF